MSLQLVTPETYSTLSGEERQSLSADEIRNLDLFERELKREVITAGNVGPISNAAWEWLNHYTVGAKAANKTAPSPDLVTPEKRKARVEYLLKLRAAARQAAADRKAASKARREGREGSKAVDVA
ncbi:hypothetical protein C8R45DRAFT_1114429 [Mycena sanguinolenta]|nr:hypothetical protein C8R45DRAFT_1114429 [Mycena sanguinolenta]